MSYKPLRWSNIAQSGTDTEQFAVQKITYKGKVCNSIMAFPYGHHANIQPTSLGVTFALDCNDDNLATLAWAPKNRPQLEPGEVTLYHPDTNSTVTWKQNGDLQIDTDSNVIINSGGDISATCTNATIDATAVDVTAGTVTITGDLIVNGTITNNGKDVGDTHGHTQGVDSAGDTQAAISGVT